VPTFAKTVRLYNLGICANKAACFSLEPPETPLEQLPGATRDMPVLVHIEPHDPECGFMPDQVATYANGSGGCPCCGTEEIEAPDYDWCGDFVLNHMVCLNDDCGAKWDEVYGLTQIILTKAPKG
jgi:hypothetical protein